MLIGYARTSTTEQTAGLEAQSRDLKAYGCKKVFSEQTSSVATRVQLEAALEYAREGDTIVVTKLDRLARSVTHLGTIVELIERKDVSLVILDFKGGPVDTRSPQGKLLLNVFGAFAQFEREVMLERQREGIAKAKAEGKYTGRKPTARAKANEVKALKAEGKTMSQIAAEVGISKGSVHRILSADA